MLRVFIGIGLPSPVKNILKQAQNKAEEEIKKARWVRPENIHLTLQFLGNCEDELVPRIDQALASVASKTEPFEFTIAKLGAFPSVKRSRVLWAGIEEGAFEIEKLHEQVENAMMPLGFMPEKRKFHSHITLARLKVPQDVGKAIENARMLSIQEPVEVRRITLFQSQLNKGGAIYSSLSEREFGKS